MTYLQTYSSRSHSDPRQGVSASLNHLVFYCICRIERSIAVKNQGEDYPWHRELT
ncbi:hypothetical protein [Microcoleus sp. Pol12A5]|uniref:hypothetical protein n=1 Tax=Microcoleus sp. Pol12A5 TaxID=3055392 RepID=UPI002FD675C0